MRENHKIETKVNFFDTTDDINQLRKLDQSKHIVNNPYKPGFNERLPREVSAKNINQMNNLYEKYTSMKENYASKNNEALNDSMEDEVMMNYRPFSAKHDDINTSSPISGYPHKNGNPNKPTNDQKSGNQQHQNRFLEQNETGNASRHKTSTLTDGNNDDSLIKDLTKLRKYALNEINQSE